MGPPLRLVVSGGSGFVGRAVCRRAVQSGLRCTALSRRREDSGESGENAAGPPAAAAEQDWARSPLMEWRRGDCLEEGPGGGEITRIIQRSRERAERVAFVHTVGSLLEKSHYKEVLDPVRGLVDGLSGLAGLAGLGGPTPHLNPDPTRGFGHVWAS